MDNKNLTIIILSVMLIIATVIIVCLLPKDKNTVYTISFNTNGGNEVVSQKVEEGKKISKPVNPSKEGYEFLGWYLNGEYFDFETEVEGNLTLEAKWKEIVVEDDKTDDKVEEDKKEDNEKKEETVTKYTVTFNSDGGSKVSKQTVEKGKKATEPKAPTKSGYTFKGWYLGNTKYDFSNKVTKNITLTAKWEKNQVVSYKVEDVPGSIIGEVKIYVTVDGVKSAGTVDITYTTGKVTVNVPATGFKEVRGTYTSISNPKVK